MKLFLKYSLYYIYNLIRLNIIKSIFLSLAFSCFYKADNFVHYEQVKILKQYELNDKFVYVYETSSSFENIITDKEIELDDNCSFMTTKRGTKYLVITFGVIILVIILVISFTDDEDIDWDLDEVRSRSLDAIIRCEIDGDIYYYMVGNRLLYKSDRIIADNYGLAYHLNLRRFIMIKNLPFYMVKSKYRTNLIDRILS